MPDYARKLYTFLVSPHATTWGTSLIDQLECLRGQGDQLEIWKNSSEYKLLHDITSSSDKLNLSKRETLTTIACHPISGQTQDLDTTAATNRLNHVLQKINAETGRNILEETDCEKVYWWFWRFYPELWSDSPDRLLHPAHSILPDCPIHSYQSTAAALSEAIGTDQEPYLLLFSFSPVQDFIKASRKFLDFWAGSYLLHYLAAKLCWEVAEQYGPDAIITPSLWSQEIIDAFLLKKYSENAERPKDRYPGFQKTFTALGYDPIERWDQDKSNSLSTAGFPNAIVVIIPGKEAAKQLGEKLTKTLQDTWSNEIGDQIRYDIRKRVGAYAADLPKDFWGKLEERFPLAKTNPAPYKQDLQQWAHRPNNQYDQGKSEYLYPNWQWQSLWNAQLKNTWEPYWSAIPLGKPGQPLEITKDQFNSDWADQQNAIAQPLESIPAEAEREIYETLNVGTWWGSFQQRLRTILDAVKRNRNWNIPISPGRRSSISGQFSAVHPSLNYTKFAEGAGLTEGTMSFFWWLMAQVYPGLFDGTEQLNAIELTKRMAWNYGGVMQELGISDSDVEMDYENLIRFPNLSSIAAARFAAENPRLILTYWNQLRQELTQTDNQVLKQGLKSFENKTKRPFQIQGADQKLTTLPGHNKGLNGVMFSSRWLAEDMNLTRPEMLELQKIIDRTHKVHNFGDASPADWWVILLADGDGMGDYVSGHKLEKYSEYLNEDAIGPEQTTQLEALKALKKRMGPATHIGLNRALLDFSNRLVPYLTEQRFCGKVVYSGGDDVMALLPIEDLPEYLLSLRAAWSGKADPKEEFETAEGAVGYWKPKMAETMGLPDRWLFTMGKTATLSAGIIIAHKSVPLPTVLESLWTAEKDGAKAMPGKDGLCFRVIYGNGNQLEALMPGKLLESWWECIHDFASYGDNLAPALYRLAEELPLHTSISDLYLIEKAASVILNRRDQPLPNFERLQKWLFAWEAWALEHQSDLSPPPGTTIDDLSKLLRFTAFWIDKRVQRHQWTTTNPTLQEVN
jgi:CRISPR-associated protein Cmr2